MSTAVPTDVPIRIAPGFRLQWEEAQNAHVLLYPEGLVRLSESAHQILSRCDGSTLDDVVAALEAAFPGVDLRADVVEFVTDAKSKGWIRIG